MTDSDHNMDFKDGRTLVTSDSITYEITKEEMVELETLFEEEVFETDARKIAVLSDIHSNMVAYQAVLDDLEEQEYDIIISLGDLIGYYTEPNEVMKASVDLFDYKVMGNHDMAAVEPSNMLFSTLNKIAQHALAHNKNILEPEYKIYLLHQPMKMRLKTPYGDITCVHGDPLTIFGYIFGATEEQMQEEIVKALSHVTSKFLFVGHTHLQGSYKSNDGKIYLNPGAVGQPRDGDPRAAYAIIDLKEESIDLRRVEYDISKVQEQIHSCEFPEYLGKRLEIGK